MSKRHKDDAHDDDLIIIEISSQIHSRAQLWVAGNTANSNILPIDILIGNLNIMPSLDTRNNTPTLSATQEANEANVLLPTILPLYATVMSAVRRDNTGQKKKLS